MGAGNIGERSLPAILEQISGIGAILIGEGDLSVDMGYPRQYEQPEVLAAVADILAICKDYKVPCGHPHVNTKNIESILQQFTFPSINMLQPYLIQVR